MSRRQLRNCAPLGFRPSRAMKEGASRHGARTHHWRTVTTESTTPVAPAASLLFQAPVFQAAPEVAPAAIVDDQIEPKRRRKSAAAEEESTPREEAAPKRRRRSKKAADDAEAADASEVPADEDQAEEAPAEPKTRRRRRSKKADEASAPAEDSADKDSATSDESDSSDDEDSSTRRRRRRRARSSASDEGGDPVDQVQALKGSTRLEAKKMRRREGRREGRRRHSISESEFLARRESVERTMVIRDQDGLDQIAILEDGLLVEHYVARRT